MRFAVLALTACVAVSGCAYLAPSRETIRDQEQMSDYEARACDLAVDGVRAERAKPWFVRDDRADQELRACVDGYREHLAKERAGLAERRRARGAEERVKAEIAATDRVDEQVGLSAALWAYAYLSGSSKEEIEAEKKYAAKGGGIVDMRKLYRLQARMRIGEEGIARLRPRIENILPREGEVLAVSNCVANESVAREIPADPICNSKTSLWAYQQ